MQPVGKKHPDAFRMGFDRNGWHTGNRRTDRREKKKSGCLGLRHFDEII
jgi:hypothetical protein